MKKALLVLSLFAMLGFVAGCGSSDSKPHCEKIETCNPACNPTSATPVCCGTTCQAMKTCTPACKTDGTEYCDPCGGTCVAMPKTCTPACNPTTQYCDNGTCKDIPVAPVCDPVCANDEVCVN